MQTRLQTAAKGGHNATVPGLMLQIMREVCVCMYVCVLIHSLKLQRNVTDCGLQEGVAALFSGLLPSLVLTTHPAIQFHICDRLKALWLRHLRAKDQPRDATALELFVIGAMCV